MFMQNNKPRNTAKQVKQFCEAENIEIVKQQSRALILTLLKILSDKAIMANKHNSQWSVEETATDHSSQSKRLARGYKMLGCFNSMLDQIWTVMLARG